MSHKVEVIRAKMYRVGDYVFMRESEYNEVFPGKKVKTRDGAMVDVTVRLILTPDKTPYRRMANDAEFWMKRRRGNVVTD